MNTQAKIYYVAVSKAEEAAASLNARGMYLDSDIKRYIDPASLKETTGLRSLVGIKGVYVSADSTGLTPHALLRYNRAYQNQWGTCPIYGNVVVVLSQKVYDTLPDERKTEDYALMTL